MVHIIISFGIAIIHPFKVAVLSYVHKLESSQLVWKGVGIIQSSQYHPWSWLKLLSFRLEWSAEKSRGVSANFCLFG